MKPTKEETTRKFSIDEYRDLADALQDHYTVFEKFWGISKPRFTNRIPTAAVAFDKIGRCVDFMVNPDFWDSMSFKQKTWVVVHECLHVFFYHGLRFEGLDKSQIMLANLAADLCVNHFTVESMGFDREVVDPKGMYCWVDTLFGKDTKIKTDESFEYYFNKIKQEAAKNPQFGEGGAECVDEHDMLESFNSDMFAESMKETMDNSDKNDMDSKKKIGEMSQKELQEALKDQPKDKKAGSNSGTSWLQTPPVKVAPKKKWETLIKEWARKWLDPKEADQWIKPSRRYTALPKDFVLPCEDEIDEYEKGRIEVWFYLDTSGSCSHLGERFFTAARSLPEFRFDVKLFCFDTKVYETDLKSGKLYGFGGTSFTCIEQDIQSRVSSTPKSKYPFAVWVVTDGYGDRVTPEKPNRWKWFLTEDYKQCIPPESQTYNLKDFE